MLSWWSVQFGQFLFCCSSTHGAPEPYWVGATAHVLHIQINSYEIMLQPCVRLSVVIVTLPQLTHSSAPVYTPPKRSPNKKVRSAEEVMLDDLDDRIFLLQSSDRLPSKWRIQCKLCLFIHSLSLNISPQHPRSVSETYSYSFIYYANAATTYNILYTQTNTYDNRKKTIS